MTMQKIHQTVTMGIFLILSCITNGYAGEAFPISTLKINQARFTIEIATTQAQQEQGLMNRKTMKDDAGMLFVFEKSEPVFMWMKNTYISLDMVFIDEQGAIIQIAENTKPLSEAIISGTKPTKAVLELKAGTCKKQSIQIGDKVIYDTFSHPTH